MARTFGFWLSGRFSVKKVVPYCLSQFAGALLASGILRVLFPEHQKLGSTLPAAGSWWQSFVYELILTLLLMYVILCVAIGAK